MSNQIVALVGLPSGTTRRIDEPILVGKDILEILTGAMYVDPLCIYREYIQNSADAIEEAQRAGLFSKGAGPKIEIFLNYADRTVRIRDNGIGIPSKEFAHRLTAIGASQKRGRKQRGFRGVGRLSGLGYCQEVTFRSRAKGESRVSSITWDGKRLKELLRDADYTTRLEDAVREIAELSVASADDAPDHFFEVELRNVTRIKNDLLLNNDEVRFYLSQIAPVPFDPQFSRGKDISLSLEKFGIGSSFSIDLNDGAGPVYRPFTDSFPVGQKGLDRFHELELLTLPGDNGDYDAVGWILHHSYFGAVSRRLGFSGVRLRIGGIQVGSADLFSELFPEPRFNSWCVGELHVLNPRIIPNARRDDFEANIHYQNLQSQFAPHAKRLAKACRDRSMVRNRLKQVNLLIENARTTLSILKNKRIAGLMKGFVERQVRDAIDKLKRLTLQEGFSENDRTLIARQVHLLTKDLEKVLNKAKRSPRISIPKQKRAAYEEVLSLIYELSSNTLEAHKLVEGVTARIFRSVRSKH